MRFASGSLPLPILRLGLVSLFTAAWVLSLSGCGTGDDSESEAAGAADLSTGSAANAQVKGAPSGLRIRSTPSTTGATVGSLANGARITVQCRVTGDTVNGDSDWDYVTNPKGYVSDAYIAKLGASFPLCSDASSSTPPLTAQPTDPEAAGAPSVPAGPPSDAANAIVAEARKWVGTHETGTNCNPFSGALGRGCEAWCADFVQYVWSQVGMSTDGLTAYAGCYLSYGTEFGTLKSPDSPDVQPGDAVVWARTPTDAAHVGLVSEVLANGDIRVIHGNWSDQVMEMVYSRSTAVDGYAIGGFVSPVPQ